MKHKVLHVAAVKGAVYGADDNHIAPGMYRFYERTP